MFYQLVLFPGSGQLIIKIGEGVEVKIDLSEQEGDTIRSMCERFYFERQRDIVAMAENPKLQLADFTEVA